MSIVVYIDGACEPQNPGGYATWSYVAIQDSKEIALNYGCIGHGERMTNNLAEYHALLNALKRIEKEQWIGAVIKSDSQLVVKQVNGEWRCNHAHLAELMNQCKELMSNTTTRLMWIPREQNERADHLSEVAYKKAIK